MSIETIINDNITGSTFISLNTETEMPLNKTVSVNGVKQPNPHFGRVTKKTDGMNVIVFQNKTTNGYDNMVRRRLEKEGINPNDFVLSERKWGVRIPETPFITHNGETYLEVIVLSSGTTKYYVNGQEVQKDEIHGQKKVSKPAQGGLSDKVIVRTFKTSSIKSIVVNKETHVL